MTTKTPTAAPTPGPWFTEVWSYQNPAREVLTVQTGTSAIAQVCDLWPPDERDAERLANARLIAAAPALLAATRQLLELVEVFADDTQGAVQTGVRALLATIDGQTEPRS